MTLPSGLCGSLICTALFFIADSSHAAFSGPAELIPAQAALPEPWGILKLLLLATFAIHLLLVNILMGSCMMALVGSLRPDTVHKFSMEEETSFIPKVLALAVNFGVAPYLFMQVLYGGFFYPSTLLLAAWWMAVLGFVILAYYGLYIISDKSAAGTGAVNPMLLFVTLALLATAFILSSNNSLMLRPDQWLDWIRRPWGTVLNTDDPTFFPRYLHVVFASAAIGGLAHAVRALWSKKRGADPARADVAVGRGLLWFRRATLAQIAAGIWFFFALKPGVRHVFLGGSAIATTALVLALLGAVTLLALAWQKQVRPLCIMAAIQVVVMISMRDMVRDTSLLPYLESARSATAGRHTLPLALEHGQNIAFGLFIACTVFAIVVTFWMARAVTRALREGARPGAVGAQEE